MQPSSHKNPIYHKIVVIYTTTLEKLMVMCLSSNIIHINEIVSKYISYDADHVCFFNIL